MRLSLTYIAKYIFKMHITERKQFYKLTHQLEEVKCSKDFKIVIAEKIILELLSNLMCKFRFALVLDSARDATTKRNVTKSLPAVSTVLTRPFNIARCCHLLPWAFVPSALPQTRNLLSSRLLSTRHASKDTGTSKMYYISMIEVHGSKLLLRVRWGSLTNGLCQRLPVCLADSAG